MSHRIVHRALRLALVCVLAGAALDACAPVAGATPGVLGATAPTPTGPPPESVCGLTIRDLSGWRGYLDLARVDSTASAQLASYVRTGEALFPSWSGMDAVQVGQVLTQEPADGAAAIRRELVILGLNVASGRLNRATTISTDSGAITVGDLIGRLERALATGERASDLIAASRQLARAAPLDQVCARVVAVENDDTIVEKRWTPGGVSQRTVAQLLQTPGAPLQIAGLHHSPDFRYAIVETEGYDSGGPLLLLDLAGGDLLDLNERVGLAVSASGDASSVDSQELWQVIGWHPDSNHVLVTAEGQDAVFWIDVAAGAYERIALPDGGAVVGSDRAVTLRPDGTAFAYLDGGGTSLWLYDMTSRQASLLLGPRGGAHLEYPSYSPDGRTIAMLVEGGEPPGSQYTLETLDPATGELSLIAQGDLGLAAPLWSQDGQWLAYSRGSGDTTDAPTAPDAPERFGFLWAANLTTQETRLVTTTGADVCQADWALGSTALAYAIGRTRLGVLPADDEVHSWQAGGFTPIAVSGSAFFLP